MEIPEYVTIEEVKRVCKEINIRDWTILKSPEIQPEEAKVFLVKVNANE